MCKIVFTVAFKIYDMDKDGFISNGELFNVLKMMVGNNLKDAQLQQIVDKTIIFADSDGDGKISFEEFCAVSGQITLSKYSLCTSNRFLRISHESWQIFFICIYGNVDMQQDLV